MRTAYIGIGSNLQQPEQQVRRALQAIARMPDLTLSAASPLYRSAPLTAPGLLPQPDYCNAVCAVQTALEPEVLLQRLLGLERAVGRIRDGQRWAPRILDLDLLHVEGVRLQTPALTLPHPGIAQRNFVLVPLAQIAPGLHLPGCGNVAELAVRAGHAGLELI